MAGRDSFGGTITEPPKDSTPTLAELGIDKKLSSRAQALAGKSRKVAFQPAEKNKDTENQ
jgi:hypothetical protein